MADLDSVFESQGSGSKLKVTANLANYFVIACVPIFLTIAGLIYQQGSEISRMTILMEEYKTQNIELSRKYDKLTDDIVELKVCVGRLQDKIASKN